MPLALVAAVLVVYLNAPQARILQWDDAKTLLADPTWQSLTWDSLKWMWRSTHYGPWQPLSWLSWCLDVQLWGLNPAALRRTNVTLHACTAGAFFLACRRLLHDENRFSYGAAGAALFFALHPLRVESVVWLTERRDVLSGLFAVLSVHLWLDGRRRSSAAAFLLAVLSKGTAIAVVPFIFLLDKDARKSWRALMPHAVIAVFAVVMNLRSLSGGDIQSLDLPLWDRILISMNGAWFYLSKTVLPINLSPYYALPLNGDGIRQASYPGALSALLVTAACCHRKIRVWALPVWIAYLLALAPVSGLFQNGRQAAADRYSYLACMPFALLFGYWIKGLELRRPPAAAAVLTATAILFTILTVRQTAYWADDVSLWNRAVAIEPDAYLPRTNLAAAYLSGGDSVAALPHLEAAIRLEPRDAESRASLGTIYASRGQFDRALELFRDSVALKSNVAETRFNLGVLLVRAGQKRDGLAHLREAVRLDPSLEKRLPR